VGGQSVELDPKTASLTLSLSLSLYIPIFPLFLTLTTDICIFWLQLHRAVGKRFLKQNLHLIGQPAAAGGKEEKEKEGGGGGVRAASWWQGGDGGVSKNKRGRR